MIRFASRALALLAVSTAVVARADEVDRIMEQQRALGAVPSVAYAVVRDGKIVKQRAIGNANLETPAKARTDTVYEIGSMTKQFTAASILLLQEDGKLKVDDTLGQHLLNCPPGWKDITLRQALSHTAGLKEYLATFSPTRTEPVRSDDIIARMAPMSLDYAPGTSWSYSNLGPYLCGLIVERYAGKRLEDFETERIFKPLGMTHTQESTPDKVIPNRARGYVFAGAGYRNTVPINPTLAGGAGNLVSTLGDMAKWEAALQTGKVFKNPETQAEFFREYTLASGAGAGYALGWFIHHDQGRPLIEHGGNTLGFSSDIFRVPNQKLAVIVLTNGGGHAPSQWARAAISALDKSYDPTLRRGPDPHPDQTMNLILMFRSWSRGNYQSPLLADSFQAQMKTVRGLALRGAFATIGKALVTADYLDGEDLPGGRLQRYAFRFKGARVILEFAYDKQGRITAMDQLYVVPDAA